MKKICIAFLAITSFIACNTSSEEKTSELSINYKKIELANGLDVIFHVDKSDPIVAVELMVHVGSAREIEGRTGFAHLFEHLLFLEAPQQFGMYIYYKRLRLSRNRKSLSTVAVCI